MEAGDKKLLADTECKDYKDACISAAVPGHAQESATSDPALRFADAVPFAVRHIHPELGVKLEGHVPEIADVLRLWGRKKKVRGGLSKWDRLNELFAKVGLATENSASLEVERSRARRDRRQRTARFKPPRDG
jgi:hypothetical protein